PVFRRVWAIKGLPLLNKPWVEPTIPVDVDPEHPLANTNDFESNHWKAKARIWDGKVALWWPGHPVDFRTLMWQCMAEKKRIGRKRCWWCNIVGAKKVKPVIKKWGGGRYCMVCVEAKTLG